MGRLTRLSWVLGLLGTGAAVGAVACFPAPVGEDQEASAGQVTADKSTANVLKSTLALSTGCMAVKVGPRHLLTAARCVAGDAAYTAKKEISFKVLSPSAAMSTSTERAATERGDGGAATEPGDAGAPKPSDAGASNEASDAGPKKNTSVTSATIEDVKVHETFSSKCLGNATCEFGVTVAAAVKDVAVIVLDAELVNIPSVPVDLDSLGSGAPVVAVESGCANVAATAGTPSKVDAVAVPGSSVKNHGSYKQADGETISRLDVNYIVTRGIGWGADAKEGKLCKSDIGAPLFRKDAAAVVGVTANFTTRADAKDIPVTIQHTRLTSQGLSAWLSAIPDLETAHGCAEDGVCPATAYDGGTPDTTSSVTPTDAGSDAATAKTDAGETGEDDEDEETTPSELTDQGEDQGTPETQPDYEQRDNPETADAGKSTKKKKKAQSGCSAAPGTGDLSSSSAMLGVGLAIAMVAARRRRTNNAG